VTQERENENGKMEFWDFYSEGCGRAFHTQVKRAEKMG
jgi:hypothetical protein